MGCWLSFPPSQVFLVIIKSSLNGVHVGTLICISSFLRNKKLLPAPGIQSVRKAYQRYRSCLSNRLFHFLEERGVQSFVV